MNEKELNKQIKQDQKTEWANESKTTHYNEWLKDNIDGLTTDFLEMYEQEFNDYCHEEYKEQNEE